MRHLLALVTLILLPGSASAAPMWEVADRWACRTTYALFIGTDGSGPETGTEPNSQTYDFDRRTVSSGLSDVQGRIGFTRYRDSRFGGFNIVEVLWGGQPYPVLIVEKDGEWWLTNAAFWTSDDRRMSVTTYRCRPEH